MSVSFDQALGIMVRVCESANLPALKSITAVRDLRGRLRLALTPESPLEPDHSTRIQALEASLQSELGRMYAGPILDGGSNERDPKRLCATLTEMARDWPDAQAEADPATGIEPPTRLRWKKLERRLAKETWLRGGSSTRPPWALGAGPSIVTFFSFKGGVGRSTALASCAWQLAKKGKRVAVVDLDLEGPGVGSLLGATGDRGVIDFFADWTASGQVGSVLDLVSPAQELTELRDKVDIYPAGRLGLAYLEKLARLDFAAASTTQTESPMARGLKSLLGKIRGHSNPDFILLDARSGLHDLAGLSLHGLSHVEVLFTRASEQGFAGLEVTLETLGRTRDADELQPVIVHAMAPAARDEIYEREKALVLEQVYELFCRHIYGEDPPALEMDDQGHAPIVIQSAEQLQRFSHLAEVEERLLAADYRSLLERIELLSKVESD